MKKETEKKFSYYFFSQGEIIEEVDADSDEEAFKELWHRGYVVGDFFDDYTRYNRTTKQMELLKVR